MHSQDLSSDISSQQLHKVMQLIPFVIDKARMTEQGSAVRVYNAARERARGRGSPACHTDFRFPFANARRQISQLWIFCHIFSYFLCNFWCVYSPLSFLSLGKNKIKGFDIHITSLVDLARICNGEVNSHRSYRSR